MYIRTGTKYAQMRKPRWRHFFDIVFDSYRSIFRALLEKPLRKSKNVLN